MRHFVFVVFFIVNCTAYTQQLALDLNEPKQPRRQLELPLLEASEKDIAAPVLIKTGKDEAQLGLFAVKPMPQKPNALNIIREELHKMEMQNQAAVQKDGVFLSTTKRFTPESISFFIAIGAVTFNSMWIKSHADPLAMERHILSLKDPIAHLSFYAFMQTQGFYMDFFSKRRGVNTMDPATRKQMMRRLTYEGMAAGSLASSIVADLGQSVKMCVDKWMLGKKDEASLESCNQAWKTWTARGKFSQYFPQIIALWATQATTDLLEGGGRKLSHWGFHKIPKLSHFTENILTKAYLVKMAYKITAADVVLTFSGGGLVLKSIKWAGKVTRFTFFVSVDHILSGYIYRPINNILKPMLFEHDALAINNLWHEADLGNWDQAKIKNPKSLEKFEKEITNYTSQMQQWREHLNQDAEADLAGWMEMTKEILNQIDYSYKYYKGFTDNLFQTLNIHYQIQNKQLAPSAATIIAGYPFRTLPFYGVSTGPYKPIGGQIGDLYISSPIELERRQKEHILFIAEKHKAVAQILKGFELKKFNSILEKLLSRNNVIMSAGLNELNKVNEVEQIYVSATGTWEENSVYSNKFLDILSKLKKELGNPQPVVYPLAGYSQAVAANSTFQITASAADYSKWSTKKKYRFNKEADLMLYKLICGKPLASLYKVASPRINFGIFATPEIDFLAPQFDPPTLLRSNNDKDLAEFCTTSKTTNNLYSTKIGSKALQDYIVANLNYNAIGDIRYNRDSNKPDLFDSWWLKSAKAPLNIEFKKFDIQFQKLFEIAYANYFDQRSYFKFYVDGLNQSKYLPKSLHASLKAEANLYLQILARVLTTGKTLPPNAEAMRLVNKTHLSTYEKTTKQILKNNSPMLIMNNKIVDKQLAGFNYLEFATVSSEKLNYVQLYKQAPREIEKLNDLLNTYSTFIMQRNVNFESYIAHSKKIDTAINDLLVLAQLKKVVSGASDSEDLGAPAAASGTENSQKNYQDIAVQNPTYKQRMAVAAVRGLRQVESEIRRFIRMRIVLAQGLELDAKEFMTDWNNANPTQLRSSGPQKPGPLGR